MRKWILANWEGVGLWEIQARDEHPERDKLTDADAYQIAQKEAAEGDPVAKLAVHIHDRDKAKIAARRAVWKSQADGSY